MVHATPHNVSRRATARSMTHLLSREARVAGDTSVPDPEPRVALGSQLVSSRVRAGCVVLHEGQPHVFMAPSLEVVAACSVGRQGVAGVLQHTPRRVKTREQELAVTALPHKTVGAGIHQYHLQRENARYKTCPISSPNNQELHNVSHLLSYQTRSYRTCPTSSLNNQELQNVSHLLS
jgi:hypothetical protein